MNSWIYRKKSQLRFGPDESSTEYSGSSDSAAFPEYVLCITTILTERNAVINKG